MAGKKLSPLYGIGGMTLLTVLLVLCLTLFSVMALANAQADLRLSEKNAVAVDAYYAADAQAAELLAWAATYAVQEPVYDGPADFAAVLQSAAQRLEKAAEWNLATSVNGGTVFLTASLPVQENQTLEVELSFEYQLQTGIGPPSVERWQVTPHLDGLRGDESLPVYTFDF